MVDPEIIQERNMKMRNKNLQMKKFVACLVFKFVTDNRRFLERRDSQSDNVMAVFLWPWIEIWNDERLFRSSGITIY